jgi:hypothetical protein
MLLFNISLPVFHINRQVHAFFLIVILLLFFDFTFYAVTAYTLLFSAFEDYESDSFDDQPEEILCYSLPEYRQHPFIQEDIFHYCEAEGCWLDLEDFIK